MEERLIVLARFSSVAEADRAASVLRGYGIEAVMQDEHVTSWFPHLAPALGGVKLQVRESDAARAAEIPKEAAL